MNINTISDVEHLLHTIPKFSSEGIESTDFSLDRFKRFCEAIGHPEKQFPSIHVAGSNGKGSTCRFIESIYRRAGFKTGIYTSPHLIDLRERFEIAGKLISEHDLVHFFQAHYAQVKAHRLTYFEIMTAVAFWWFARENIDIGVIETGLGGRLDATNVIKPLVSVITSITLDHTAILGDTIEEIAREKGGIIKHGVPVVMGNVSKAAQDEIEQIAYQKECKVSSIQPLKPKIGSGVFHINTGDERVKVDIPLYAPVQANNMAMAWLAVKILNKQLPVAQQHIAQGISNAEHKARFEKISPTHNWYFDGAHNVEAIKALKKTINTIGNADEATWVIALMGDKLNKKMIKELWDVEKIFYYTPTTKRGARFDEVVEWLPQIKPFPAKQECRRHLLDEFKNELVIFGGSLYFYPTVKQWISHYH